MMPTLSIAIVAGASPNLMRITPMVQALQERKADALPEASICAFPSSTPASAMTRTYRMSTSGNLRSRSRTVRASS